MRRKPNRSTSLSCRIGLFERHDMAKPYIWTGKTEAGDEIKGEGYDDEDCRLRAESMGCIEHRVEENPEYTVTDEIDELTPEVVSHSGKDLQMEDSMQNLAVANAKMFEQLNALKNIAATGVNLATMVQAYYTKAVSTEFNRLDNATQVMEELTVLNELAKQVLAEQKP